MGFAGAHASLGLGLGAPRTVGTREVRPFPGTAAVRKVMCSHADTDAVSRASLSQVPFPATAAGCGAGLSPPVL